MHNLFGDRFLRLFAGDLQRRPKGTKSNVKDQNPEVKAEYGAEPVALAFEEGDEENLVEGNQIPNEEEQNKKNDTER